MIGLIGVIGASIINLFLASGAPAMAVSVIGVIGFNGLTARDMQRLRNKYLAHQQAGGVGAQANLGKLQIMGAHSLYLNLINLFQMRLSLSGQRQEG